MYLIPIALACFSTNNYTTELKGRKPNCFNLIKRLENFLNLLNMEEAASSLSNVDRVHYILLLQLTLYSYVKSVDIMHLIQWRAVTFIPRPSDQAPGSAPDSEENIRCGQTGVLHFRIGCWARKDFFPLTNIGKETSVNRWIIFF